MLKVAGEGLDLQPRGHSGLLAVFPADDRREMHWRKQILLDIRQNRKLDHDALEFIKRSAIRWRYCSANSGPCDPITPAIKATTTASLRVNTGKSFTLASSQRRPGKK